MNQNTRYNCGAGISFNSGLPLVTDLVTHILEKLETSQEGIDLILQSKLPFEAFMEVILDLPDSYSFLSIFELDLPNTNHIFLAKLAKAGFLKLICITNFDQLIEVAFEKEGLKEGIDYKIFYDEYEFNRINWSDKTVKLLKIHGSIVDKKNIAITLRQISSKAITNSRKSVIQC
jgi:NAD-dependent SIR2 family protein deacetylase